MLKYFKVFMQNMRVNKEKELKVQELEKIFETNKGLGFFNSKGLLSNEINAIRKKARAHDIKIVVEKNSLWKIAITNKVKNCGEINLKNNVIGFVASDSIKALGFYNFLTSAEKRLLSPLMIIDKGGILDNPTQITNISKLKSKEEAVAKLILTCKFPLIKLVKILNLIQEKKA